MKLIKNPFLILLLLALVACSTQINRSPAEFGSEYTYGAELTFTNPRILEAQRALSSGTVNSEMSEDFQKQLIDRILHNCDECKLQRKVDKYGLEYGRIVYPDGWYFNVTLDPAVVEVTAKPIPDSKLAEYTKRLDRDLYASAQEIGLRPSRNTGGGHIHFGADAFFEGNPDYFRDFMVDMYNHSEIGSGILADDHYNSPPIKAHPAPNRNGFIEVINKYDQNPEGGIVGLGLEIREKAYNYQKANWGPTEKYQAINIERMVVEGFDASEETVEIRCIRPQQSAEQFGLIANLFKKRMNYLKRLRDSGTPVQFDHQTGMTGEQKFESFIRFITQADEDPADYFRLLPAEYMDMAWEKLERLHPGNLEKKIAFIRHASNESPFDANLKARKAMDYLRRMRDSDPQFVLDRMEVVVEVFKNTDEKYRKPEKAQELLAEVEKFMNASALPKPSGFRATCDQIIKSLSLPVFKAL